MGQIFSHFQSDELLNKAIAAVITALIGVAFNLLRPNPRVVWGMSHQFAFNVPQAAGGSVLVHSRTVFIQNVGRASGDDIEVHFTFKPEHFQVWPVFDYSTTQNPENQYIIKFRNLGKREFLTIEILNSGVYFPDVLRVRTRRGECKKVEMAPMRVMPTWMARSALALILVGIFAIVQGVLSLAGF